MQLEATTMCIRQTEGMCKNPGTVLLIHEREGANGLLLDSSFPLWHTCQNIKHVFLEKKIVRGICIWSSPCRQRFSPSENLEWISVSQMQKKNKVQENWVTGKYYYQGMYLRLAPLSFFTFNTFSGTRLFMSRRISASGRVMKDDSLADSSGTA